MKNLYDILGVKKNASEAEIKSAYRTLAKELHPDRNPGDDKVAERFKEVSAAYAILGDKKRRAQYDRGEIDETGQQQHPFARGGGAGAHGAGAQNFGGFQDIFREFEQQARQQHGPGAGHKRPGGEETVFEFTEGPEDFFSNIFGFGKGRTQARKKARSRAAPFSGGDVTYSLTISFMDAVKGITKTMTLQNGKTLNVKIPAGVREGQQIRLRGQGDKGIGGRAGDALIKISIAPHPWFERDGDDIYLTLPITIDEAVLGATVAAPTIRGDVKVKIPPNSSSGRKLRLKGKGIETEGKAGDQYITLRIDLPEKPDKALQNAIKDWKKSHGYSVRNKFRQ